jgi:hypothetical protein
MRLLIAKSPVRIGPGVPLFRKGTMKRISALKVTINFECLSCKKTKQYGISESIENGAPYCKECQETMEVVDCELDTMEA